MSDPSAIRAVFWDFGGVVLTSPFDAFREYEARRGLPRDFIRSVNTHNPDDNAWARLERGDVDLPEFCRAFEAESAALGHAVPGEEALGEEADEAASHRVQVVAKSRARSDGRLDHGSNAVNVKMKR